MTGAMTPADIACDGYMPVPDMNEGKLKDFVVIGVKNKGTRMKTRRTLKKMDKFRRLTIESCKELFGVDMAMGAV